MGAVIPKTVERAIKFQSLCRSQLKYVIVLFIQSMLILFERKNRVPVNEGLDCRSCSPYIRIIERDAYSHSGLW